MARVLDELQAESRALVCGREASKTSLLFEEEQACDRAFRSAGCSNELENIDRYRRGLLL